MPRGGAEGEDSPCTQLAKRAGCEEFAHTAHLVDTQLVKATDSEGFANALSGVGTPIRHAPPLKRSLGKRQPNDSMSLLKAMEKGSCRPTRPSTAPSSRQCRRASEQPYRRGLVEPELVICSLGAYELESHLMSEERLHHKARNLGTCPENSHVVPISSVVGSEGDLLHAARQEAIAARTRLTSLVNVAVKSGSHPELGPKAEVCTRHQSAALKAAATARSGSSGRRGRAEAGRQGGGAYSWLGKDVALNTTAGQLVRLLTPRRALAERRRLQKMSTALSRQYNDMVSWRGEDSALFCTSGISRVESEPLFQQQRRRPSTAPAARRDRVPALEPCPQREQGDAVCTEARAELDRCTNHGAACEVVLPSEKHTETLSEKASAHASTSAVTACKHQSFDLGIDLRFVKRTPERRRGVICPRSSSTSRLLARAGRR